MAWFNRQSSKEPQIDYLSVPDTATRPMALVSLMLTFLIISGLIFLLIIVGRLGYERIMQNNNADTPSTTSQTEDAVPSPITDGNQSDSSQPSGTSTAPPSQVTPPSTTNNQPANQSSTSTATPSTGPSAPATMPSTGPEHLVGLFIATCLLAMSGYYGWRLHQLA